jgi:hypothetical protein
MGARRSDADGVAVGGSLGHNLRADIAACARAILDDDLLAQHQSKLLCDNPRDDVGTAARRKWHDQADRALRPTAVAGLRGSARYQHHPD